MDYLTHVANVVYLVSFIIMRDILWLRIFTVIAATCLILYLYFQPQPLLPVIYLNLAFITLNVFWIIQLLPEQRLVKLTDKKKHLCHLAFHSSTPGEMLKLLKFTRRQTASTDECLISQGKPIDRLVLVYTGKACTRVAEVTEGQFIGATGFITDDVTPTNVIALEPKEHVSWSKTRLQAFLRDSPDLRAALQSIPGVDLITRLKDSWTRLDDSQVFSRS